MHQTSPQTIRLPRLQSALQYEGNFQVNFHVHTAVELVYTQHGDIRIDVDGVGYRGQKNVLYILPANVPHNQWCAGAWKTLCVLYFDGAHLLDDRPRTLEISNDSLIRRWFDDLCALHASPTPVSDAASNAFLYALLTHIGNLEQQRRSADALHPRLAQAVQYLHEHLSEEIDAESIASAACASYSHLSALFRETFGCGPIKYQQNLRLASAQKLLLNPYMSLDEIAQQSGYEDTNYFVRLFRKAYGKPPGKWRKENVRTR
jgi:AraC-like DNA-binding protein